MKKSVLSAIVSEWAPVGIRWLGCGVEAAVVAVEAVAEEAADEEGDEEAMVVVDAELDECNEVEEAPAVVEADVLLVHKLE